MDKTLVKNALKLKDQEKLALIELLYQSLDKPDAEVEQAWLEEAEARAKAIDEGRAKLIPMEEVFEKYK